MKFIYGLSLSLSMGLTACGGGETMTSMSPQDTIPPLVPAGTHPANPLLSSSEVDAGSFEFFFAQSERDPTGNRRPGRAEVSSGIATFYSENPGEMTLVTPSGVRYVFEENGPPVGGVRYQYSEKNGGTNTLEIERHGSDGHYSIFKIGEIDQVADVRATLHYGWRTSPSVIQASSGVATYFRSGGGQLFLSDGRRIFGGSTTLAVDFANNRIDGTLMDNRGNRQFNLESLVTVTNASLNADGTVTGNGGISVVLDDNNDPMTLNGPVTNDKVSGQFYGANADQVSGIFEGEVDISQPIAGDSTLGFVGTFSALK